MPSGVILTAPGVVHVEDAIATPHTACLCPGLRVQDANGDRAGADPAGDV